MTIISALAGHILLEIWRSGDDAELSTAVHLKTGQCGCYRMPNIVENV